MRLRMTPKKNMAVLIHAHRALDDPSPAQVPTFVRPGHTSRSSRGVPFKKCSGTNHFREHVLMDLDLLCKKRKRINSIPIYYTCQRIHRNRENKHHRISKPRLFDLASTAIQLQSKVPNIFRSPSVQPFTWFCSLKSFVIGRLVKTLDNP